jgi:tRNA 2-thiouridine synthesizing protein E
MAREHAPAEAVGFDDDGFLVDPGLWSEELARRMAELDGLGPLGERHWRVIQFLREHHLAHGTLPPLSYMAWALGMDRHGVRELFHNERELWRLAGLPNPGEEAKAYMQ